MSPFDLSRLTPHGFCLAWQPGLIWLEAGSDLVIAAAYFSIPATLLLFLRHRRDLAFKPVFGLFAAFILACGATHILGAVTLWVPAYWVDAWLKAITAALSIGTAVMLWPLVPKALALPSPSHLREVNEALAREVAAGQDSAARLQTSELRQKVQYARTPAALHVMDPQGVLLDVSDRWLDLVGYDRAQVIGRNMAEFYEPDSAQDLADHLAALRAGSLLMHATRRLRCRDGRVRDLDVVLDVERDAAGRLQRVLAAFTDVTAARETEQALRAAEERLHQAQKMEAVGQLTGGIAHDFNNLLTTIMGSLELLQQRGTLDERGVKLTENALEGSRRAARLTSQLLSFSRRARLSPEVLDPCAVIDGMRDLLARTLGDRITLEVALGPEPCWAVKADRSQMEAALLNLVINARDAITGQGRVVIAAVRCFLAHGEQSHRQHGADRIPPGDYACISVTDTGCGMSPEVHAHAFEPFFTTKPPGAGSGLGLSQLYGFVVQSGGLVRVETAPGQGTTVKMMLPRAAAVAREQAAPAANAPCGHGEHVLLVEDDALLRHAMAAALQARGFRVTPAADGEQAMAVLAKGGVHVLFTDLRMPGALSGVDLAWAARARWPGLPVLLATGYETDADLRELDDTAELLAKPYTVDQLVSRLAGRLHGRAGATALSA